VRLAKRRFAPSFTSAVADPRSEPKEHDERPPVARGAASTRFKLFSKDFRIQAIFRQAFPKNPLAVLWDFKGLQ
jgi:hypothetical protein